MSEEHNMELYKMKEELCKTLSDPKRLIIIYELRCSEKTVGELTQLLMIPQAATSRHLAILRDRGVVCTRREGTSIYYALTDPKIGEACAMVHEILISQIQKNREFAEKVTP